MKKPSVIVLINRGLNVIWCLLARIRTWDPLIKSQLLYQLSYEEFSGCKDTNFSRIGQKQIEINFDTFVTVMQDRQTNDK